ncbi:MAG TPA: hypothetical protein VF789_19140 [Thermoanaerobaculia bacterium]
MSLTMLDLNSEARDQQTLNYSTEPVSPLPRIWIGFVLAFGFLVAEIVEAMQGNETAIGPWTLLASVAGSFYWFHCVHRFHRILGQLSPHVDQEPTYPVTPRQAVGYHFIPVFNIFWLFKWPIELVKFLSERTSVKIASGGGLGTILFFSVLTMRLIDGFLGLSLMFGFALYLSRKLRQAVAEHQSMRGAVGVFA